MSASNSLYPVFLQLHDRKVLVVGGGSVAERKVRALLRTGARVHVGAPELSKALSEWNQSGTLTWHRGNFEPTWLDQVWLVVAATDDRQVNAQISELATARGIWINVVDDPELSSFQVPAVVDRAPITVAISSGGYAPVLSRRLRERLEALVDHQLGTLASMLGDRRAAIRAAYPDLAQRRHFYDWTLDGPIMQLLSGGQAEAATRMLDEALRSPATWPRAQLTVLASPERDPGLLTLKGLRALHEADALMFDPRHHEEAVLGMARRDADRIPVHLEEWLTHGDVTAQLQKLLQAHGRLVMLVRGSEDYALQALSSHLDRLEAAGIPVQRLYI